MKNPFEAGLPRQEVNTRAIVDSLESNRNTDFMESDYHEIYDALLYSGNFNQVDKLFRNLGLNRSEWNLNPELDNLRKEVLREYLSEFYRIEDIAFLLEFTNYKPDWVNFENNIGWRYVEMIRDHCNIEDFVREQEYFGFPINWDDPIMIDAVINEYRNDLENGEYNHLIKLSKLSNIKFEWQGNLKHDFENALRSAINDYYNYEKMIADLLNLVEESTAIKPDWQRELKLLMTEYYEKFLKNERLPKIESLQIITGVIPDWQGELKPIVIKKYKEFLEDGRYGYLTIIVDLQEISGVIPDWNGELKPLVMNNYGLFLKNNDLNKIIDLQEKSGVIPDWKGELKPAVMERYGILINNVYLNSITELQEQIGVTPDWHGELKPLVMEKYRGLLEGGKSGYLSYITGLQEMSGLIPDWQGELKPLVMKRYGIIVIGDGQSKIVDLQEISGVIPDWKGELKPAVMERYGILIKYGYLDDINKLYEVSGVPIDWKGDLKSAVMKGYGKCIEDNRLDRIADLHKMSGILPDWQGELKTAVMEGYAKFVNNDNLYKVVSLEEISGVIPDWQGELKPVVMKRYEENIKNDYINDLIKLQKKSGVVPDWHGELKPAVMKGYSEYLKNYDNFLDKVDKLQKFSGVIPDWQGELKPLVMKEYDRCVKKDLLDNIIKLHEVSGVIPDWQGKLKPLVMEGYGKLIKENQSDRIAELQKMSDVAPDWKGSLMLKVCEAYIFNRNKDNIDNNIQEMTGISLDEAVKEVDFWNFIINTRDLSALEYYLFDKYKDVPEVNQVFESCLLRKYDEILIKSAIDNKEKALEFLQTAINRYKIKPTRDCLAAFLPYAVSRSDYLDRFLLIAQLCGYRDIGKLNIEQIRNKELSLRGIVLLELLNIIPDDVSEKSEFVALLQEKKSYANMAIKMARTRNIPAPARREDYCPWKKDLEPLLDSLKNRYDFNQIINQDAMIEAIQLFGMKNLKLLMSVVIDLLKVKRFLKEDQENKNDALMVFCSSESGINLQNFLNVISSDVDLEKIDKPQDIDKIIKVLKNKIMILKEDILADRMPDVIEQDPVMMEVFNSIMVKSGSWANNNHGYTREKLMAEWRETLRNSEQKLPDYYRSNTYEMKIQKQESLLDAFKGMGENEQQLKINIIKQEIGKKREAILKREEYITYLAPFYAAFDESERLGELVSDPKITFFSALKHQEEKLRKLIEQLETVSDATENAKKKAGMRASIEKQEVLLRDLERFATIEGIKDLILDSIHRKQQEIEALEKEKGKAVEELPALEKELVIINISIEREGNNVEKKKERQRVFTEIQKFKSILERSTESVQKDIERMKEMIYKMEQNLQPNEKEYLILQAMITAVANTFDRKTAISIFGNSLQLITSRMIMFESSAHVQSIREAHNKEDVLTEYSAWRTFFQEQLIEHFIDPEYADYPRVVAFPKEAIDLLESIWHLNNIRQKSIEILGGESKNTVKHPFLRVVTDIIKIEAEIKALEEQGLDALNEKIEVTYFPCHGLGRIFAGDVGDACYTSHRYEFAKGKYPNLHSLLISTKDKKNQDIRLLGSILLIEGKNIKGKKYLFARAVNPIDSVLKREISAEDFLKGLLDYLKTTANDGDFDETLLCVDTAATRSGSNRKEMFNAMVKAVSDNGWPIADALESTNETNFKYKVWDTASSMVYRVWAREEN